MRVFGSRARRLVAVGLGVGVFVCFSSPGGRQQTVPIAIVASGRKALGKQSIAARISAAMIDLAPLGYVLYAAAALAFIWLLQNAAQL